MSDQYDGPELARQVRMLREENERLRAENGRLQRQFDDATHIIGFDEARQYITSGNCIPVTRCSVSAEHLRQLIERAERAEAGLDALGVAIVNAGYTWTPEMRGAYEKATNRKG